MSDNLWRTLNTALYAGSSFVAFVGEIAILVVIATVVRRHRPDAYSRLQTWAIVSLAGFVALNIGRTVMPMVAARSSDGLDSFFRINGILTILGTILHVVLVVLLIRGLIALAQPPKPPVVEGAPPYR